MAKVVRDENNRFRTAWSHVRDNEGSRQMMADSLGIDRGRLNDLILGRAKPTLGEQTALSGKRRGNYVVYRDDRGKEHSVYTAQGKSFEEIAEDMEDLDDMLADIAYDRDYPIEGNRVVVIKDQYNPRSTWVSMFRPSRSRQIGLRPQPGRTLGSYSRPKER